jgi:hypothetical protein
MSPRCGENKNSRNLLTANTYQSANHSHRENPKSLSLMTMNSDTEHPSDVLWKPLPSSGFHIKNLIRIANEKHGAAVTDYESLWAWSTNAATAPAFWMEVFEYLGIKTSEAPYAAMQPHVRAVPSPSLHFGIITWLTELPSLRGQMRCTHLSHSSRGRR